MIRIRRSIIGVIAIAVVAIVIVAAFAMSGNGNDKSTLVNDNGSNGNTKDSGQNGTGPKSNENTSSSNVTATSPGNVLPGNEHLSLATTYPGAGNASYTYDWKQTFVITVTISPKDEWNGRVALLAFVNKVGANIGTNCMLLSYDGSSTKWTVTSYDGSNLENGHVLVFTTNDSSSYVYHLEVGFNETGTGVYDVVLQAFDADSGQAISQPLYLAEMNVPPMGSLDITSVGNGSFTTIDGISYYEVVLNVTNDWNICHTVYLQNLTLEVGNTPVLADQYQSTLVKQTLDPGQLTQFVACFPTMDTGAVLKLTYDDNGTMIDVPLG